MIDLNALNYDCDEIAEVLNTFCTQFQMQPPYYKEEMLALVGEKLNKASLVTLSNLITASISS